MRMQRLVRRDGRLDHQAVAHGRIKAARFEGGPSSRGQGRGGGPRDMAAVRLGQQQPRRADIGPGNMRVDVDGPGHDDLAGGVKRCVGRAPRGADDALPFDPDIADAVAVMGGVDDAAIAD